MSSATRIEKRFADLKREGRAALVTFVTAGDPDYDTSFAILKALPGAGAEGRRTVSFSWIGHPNRRIELIAITGTDRARRYGLWLRC